MRDDQYQKKRPADILDAYDDAVITYPIAPQIFELRAPQGNSPLSGVLQGCQPFLKEPLLPDGQRLDTDALGRMVRDAAEYAARQQSAETTMP